MELFERVETYIEDNIYHSRLWDQSDELDKLKAFNQAHNTLVALLRDHFHEKEVEAEDIAQQALWIMKLDDTFQRAEMGVTSIAVDGTSIQLAQIDRSVAPFVLNKHNISQVKKRKVGHYAVPLSDTSNFYGGY